MRKGEMTRAAILDVAITLASRDGLEGLTIGLLAEKMNMSKSGVFAHFGSREDLQIEVVKLYHRQFEQEVFYPSIKEARGLPRLEAMFARWIRQVTIEVSSGCIYISGAVEYDDRPGEIREQLVSMVRTWQQALHHDARFLNKAGSVERAQRGFDHLIDSYRNIKPVSKPVAEARKSSQTTHKISAKTAAR